MLNTFTKSVPARQAGTRFLLAVTALSCVMIMLPGAMAGAGDDADEMEAFTVTRHDDFFRAESDRINLYVSPRIVDMKPDEKPTGYIALIFGVWNRKAKPFYVDRDRIRLLDRYGNEIPMAGLEELRKNYPHLRRDQQHRDFTTFGGRFLRNSRLVPTNFSPPPGTALAVSAQLHRHRRVKDLLYFKGTMEPDEPYTLVITLRKSGVELAIPFQMQGDAGDGKPLESTVSGSISLTR